MGYPYSLPEFITGGGEGAGGGVKLFTFFLKTSLIQNISKNMREYCGCMYYVSHSDRGVTLNHTR